MITWAMAIRTTTTVLKRVADLIDSICCTRKWSILIEMIIFGRIWPIIYCNGLYYLPEEKLHHCRLQILSIVGIEENDMPMKYSCTRIYECTSIYAFVNLCLCYHILFSRCWYGEINSRIRYCSGSSTTVRRRLQRRQWVCRLTVRRYLLW